MERKQKGITLMSFIVVLALLGFFALIAMKLFPMYSEYFSLKRVMDELAAQPNSASMTTMQIQSEMERRFDIAYISSVQNQHIKVVRNGRNAKLNVAYEVRTPLLGNLDVVGRFDNTVDLGGASTGG